jgi:site-specific recombinase XerD
MTAQELATGLLVAAHDAGIADARDVTPAALRHTYIAFLVRQGARFADITRRVGSLDADQLAEYSVLAPAGVRVEADAVQTVFPALAADQAT